MTIEGLIGLVDHIKESTAPREERAAVDSLSSALNTMGSSSGDPGGAARADCDPTAPADDGDGQAAVERRAQEEARRAQQEVEELRRLVQRRKCLWYYYRVLCFRFEWASVSGHDFPRK